MSDSYSDSEETYVGLRLVMSVMSSTGAEDEIEER